MPTSKENISVPYLDFDPHLNPLDNPPKHRKPRKAPRREVRPVVENESAKAVMTHLPTHRRLPEERIVVNLRNGQKRLPNQNQKKEVAQLRAQAQKRKDPLRQKQNHHQAAGQRVTTHRHNITPEVLHASIEQRLRVFKKLMMLQGKLDLLLNASTARLEQAGYADDIEQEEATDETPMKRPLMVYQES